MPDVQISNLKGLVPGSRWAGCSHEGLPTLLGLCRIWEMSCQPSPMSASLFKLSSVEVVVVVGSFEGGEGRT